MLVITRKTRTADILPLLITEERFKAVIDGVPALPLDVPVLNMTVGQFIEATEDKDYSMRFLKEKYALKAFGHLKSFLAEIKKITDYLETLAVPRKSEEVQASEGVPYPSFGVRVLLDCVKAFHLHSMDEAEAVPLTSWLAVYQDAASAAIYQRNLAAINDMKMKGARR